jgi:type IV secretory pathway TrbL component
MRPLDLVKATIFCGLLAFLVYTWPVLGQAIIIGSLSLLWLSYLYRTVVTTRAR